MPTASGSEDHWLHFLEERLGAGFHLATPPNAPHSVAVRLPDGTIFTAHLPQRFEPPFLGGPIATTVMFVVLSVTLLGLWAARALTRPLSAFAETAENFSLDGDVAALPEKGPEEIRTVARALNRMRERIRKLVDDRTRLLAAMGHDLRTPITRLRLRSEFVGDEELRGHMLRDLDQMKAMTDGVLSFLRDGEPREAATRVDLACSLQTICDQFGDLGHAVRYEGPGHLTITARPDDLQRAVANLVDNAVRHATSTVVRLAATPQSVVIEVEDDGPGIPDDSKEAMLEAFVRGEAARTMDDRAGFGLGLSIARAVAEAHGGRLSLHDRVPHGLIARITLPPAAFTPAAAA
jgi:signal transduction histidine kinase